MLLKTRKNESYRVGGDLYLNYEQVGDQQPVQSTQVSVVDHLFVVDVSGSMHSNLYSLRKDLKNELSNVVGENHTVTVVWFSSKGDWGVIKERVQVNTPQQLQALKDDIDRYLVSQWLTGFEDPLRYSIDFCEESKKNGASVTFTFLTDGHDNQSQEQVLLELCEQLSSRVSTSVILGVGYWINTKFLLKMTEKIGGVYLHSKEIEKLAEVLNQIFSGKVVISDKVIRKLQNDPYLGLVYTLSEQGIATYSVTDRQVSLPETTEGVWYWTQNKGFDHSRYLADLKSFHGLNTAYASLALLSERGKSNQVYSFLKGLGDVNVIKKFTNAFGKERLASFQDFAKNIALGKEKMFQQGVDINFLPDENAYCILNLFDDLTNNQGKWCYQAFSELVDYKRIGVSRDRSGVMTDSVVQELEQLLAQLQSQNKNARVADTLDKLKEQLNARSHKETTAAWNKLLKTTRAKASKQLIEKGLQALEGTSNLKFIPSPPKFVELHDLQWNRERANLSLRVKILGHVEVPENDFNIKSTLDSFSYKTFNFILDGVVNTKKLHFQANPKLISKLEQIAKKQGFVVDYLDQYKCYEIDLEQLPVINRKMVTTLSAKTTFTQALEKIENDAEFKVFNHYLSKLKEQGVGVAPQTLTKMYGLEAKQWLESKGLGDNLEYKAKGVATKSGEEYTAVKLNLKISGLSKLPSVKEVEDRIDSGKSLLASQDFMASAILEYRKKLSQFQVRENSQADLHMKVWLESRLDQVKSKRAFYRNAQNVSLFSVIVGQTWYSEFATMEENSMVINYKGKQYQVSAVYSETLEKI